MMTSALRLHDTCGVHNLHGMPAILSAVASAIFASMVKKENYKSDFTAIFPAMGGSNNNGTMEMVLGVI